MAAVVLRKVEKIYDSGFKVVRGIDLDIDDGEFMIFIGPSGCVKSTTLYMITGLEDVSGGEIYISGRLVNTLPPKDRSTAMVFRDYALYPHKTVFNSIAFGLKMQKRPKEKIKKIVEEAAEKPKVSDLLCRKPKEMSGDQRQRIAVGRTIVRKPDVFLFDEPLSSLDAKLRVSMRVKIAQLHQSLENEDHPAIMIYVTHDQIEILTLGDHICVLNQGRIMQAGTPVNLYNHPANRSVVGSIDSLSMNLIDAVVREEDGRFYIHIARNIRLYIPESRQSVLKVYIDKLICLDVRLEHIFLNTSHKEMNTVTGVLSIIGNMGSEKYLYFTVSNKELITKVNSQSITTTDIRKNLYFNLDTSFYHIFDFYTEENPTNYL